MNRFQTVSIGLLVVLASGCGSARRGAPYAEAFAPETDVIANGERVFYQHCHKCHTGGESSLGPAINNKPLPGWLMRFQVRHGLGTMPEFSEKEIGQRDLNNLIDYLVALRSHPSD